MLSLSRVLSADRISLISKLSQQIPIHNTLQDAKTSCAMMVQETIVMIPIMEVKNSISPKKIVVLIQSGIIRVLNL